MEKSLGGFSKKSWGDWLNHKSNKERWIEAQGRSEEAEIDEGGEDLEDEEKIADAIDTEDLGAKADYEYAKEKSERLGL